MIDPSEHLGLADTFGRRFAKANRLDPEECVAAANLALVKAARYFDPSRGWKFSTYAVRAIRNNLLRLEPSIDRRRAASRHDTLSINARNTVSGGTIADILPAPDPTRHEGKDHSPIDLEAVREAAQRMNQRSGDQRGSVVVYGLAHGWTLQQMSAAMGCTKENARLVLRGLRAAMGESEAPPRRFSRIQQNTRAFAQSHVRAA